MMKSTIMVAGVCSVFFCIQATAADAKAATPAKQPATAESATESAYRNEIVSLYAEQDKELARADELAKHGEYTKAIRIYQNVFFGLSLEAEQRNSWIAKQRLAEISRRLEDLKMTYGSKKLQEANNAFEGGRYNDAVTLSADAAAICPALSEKAAYIRTMSQSRQRGEERMQQVSAYNLVPQLAENEKTIADDIASARVLMKHRRFEEARRRIENVYKLNPFNQEAAYLASQIYSQYYTAGYHRAIADARSMMAREAWNWVEPVFYRNVPPPDDPQSQIKAASDHGIQAQLDSITIPSVKYDATDISSVVKHLMTSSKNNDASGKGVIIDYNAPNQNQEVVAENNNAAKNTEGENLDEAAEAAGGAAQPAAANPQQANAGKEREILVTLNVNKATLREILDYISFLTDLPYRVYPDRIVIGVPGDDVKTETFKVTSEAVAAITGDQNNAPEAEAGETGGGEGGGSEGDGALIKGEVMNIEITPDDLKRFFTGFGIDFSNRSSSINYSNGKIIMTNTQDNLNRMDKLLLQLNTASEMVQIELKSIEISENDMEELGFNWSLGSIGRAAGSGGHESSWSAGQGKEAALGKSLNQLGSSLTGVGATLVNNMSLFPDILGSIKPFDSDIALNLSLTISALDRNDRSETISAPSVTVANGRTATVKLTTKYYFPSSWEELEVDLSSGDDAGNSVDIEPPIPEFDDETDVGTIFTVTPQIKKNNIIGLAIKPEVTAYIGRNSETVTVNIERWDASAREFKPDAALSRAYEVWKPLISTRSLTLDVNVKNGETLVLGGLSDSQISTRLDKIPFFGDLPLIGRLFQSQSEMSTRKNMLIFVTARLVNDAGRPTNMLENDGGIPDVNR